MPRDALTDDDLRESIAFMRQAPGMTWRNLTMDEIADVLEELVAARARIAYLEQLEPQGDGFGREERTMYMVVSGQYSDYGVHCVFGLKEDAQLYIDTFNRGGSYPYEIEEVTANPSVSQLKAGRLPYTVIMLRGGEVESTDKGLDAETGYRIDLRGLNEWVTEDWHPHLFGKPPALIANVWATDEAHAVKIAGEMRAGSILKNEWPEVT